LVTSTLEPPETRDLLVSQNVLFKRVNVCARYASEYVSGLLEYLKSFHARVKPVIFLENVVKKAEDEFDEQWRAGVIPGWEDRGVRAATVKGEGIVDLEAFDSALELETIGPEAGLSIHSRVSDWLCGPSYRLSST
jgi:hypothetical protein